MLEQFVPTTDRRSAISRAQALGVLLRSLVVEREPVHRQQETVHGFGPSLFGISAEQMTRLTDDRLGRALDHLFDADLAALLPAVVVAVGQRFNVSFARLHNDSTAVAFCGQYRAATGRQLRGRSAPAIVHGFSKDHRSDWAQIASTNPLKRLNAEIKRRTNVVGIFPNDAAITRLVGALLLEQNDEWQLQRRYLQPEGLQPISDNQSVRLSAVMA